MYFVMTLRERKHGVRHFLTDKLSQINVNYCFINAIKWYKVWALISWWVPTYFGVKISQQIGPLTGKNSQWFREPNMWCPPTCEDMLVLKYILYVNKNIHMVDVNRVLKITNFPKFNNFNNCKYFRPDSITINMPNLLSSNSGPDLLFLFWACFEFIQEKILVRNISNFSDKKNLYLNSEEQTTRIVGLAGSYAPHEGVVGRLSASAD